MNVNPSRPFKNREHAGQVLADRLKAYANRSDVVVLALPRGGVPVGFEVAAALHAPLDVFVVRKLGVPGQEELAMGAIASGGVRVMNAGVLAAFQSPSHVIESVVQNEERELVRREHLYRDDRPLPNLKGHTVILVDDGLATGSTMRAATQALRQHQPAWIVVGVPIASAETCQEFRSEVDEIICAITPEPFYAVGLWYEDFSQTTDDEVRDLLARASRELAEREA